MNILVIGNGFDLAHGLPTKYTDFLEFCRMIKVVYYLAQNEKGYIFDNDEDYSCLENKEDMWDELDLKFSYKEKEFNSLYMKLCSKRIKAKWLEDEDEEIIITDTVYDELNKLIKNNFWIYYFLNNSKYLNENWIDFESEISHLIQSMDMDMHSSENNFDLYDDIEVFFSNDFLENLQEVNGCEKFKEIRDILDKDLNSLIRALEIYLCGFVEKIKIQEKSPDIDSLEFDFILSFNYTHIFSKLYDVSSRSKREVADSFDYIHGEVNIKNSIGSNNMVLGIDEYLPKKRKNKDIDFIAFKKYYQRIYKQTGIEYKRWVEVIKNQVQKVDDKIKKQYPIQIPYNKIPNEYRNQLYIFGHSLDVTDKDILRDLILNDNVYTTIFYHNKDTMGQQIANLVKVIGQDELIRRTGGSTKTIEFKQQQKMVPINN